MGTREYTHETDHLKCIDYYAEDMPFFVKSWHTDYSDSTTDTWTMPFDADVMGYFVTLQEVPDSSAKTYILTLTDGSNDITGDVTFTEATDSAGALKSATIDTSYNSLSEGDSLVVDGADGTTSTNGEAWVTVIFKRTG